MSVLYPIGKKGLLDGTIDLLDDTIKAALIDTAVYTYSAAHDFYDDLSAGVVGTPVALTNKTTTAGVFDADPTVILSVTGDSCEAIGIYKDTGTPTTSPLIAYIDSGTGLPVTPDGNNITLTWSGSGIFGLEDPA